MYKLLEYKIRHITPLIIIPYVIISCIVIPYYVYRKYKNWRKIRNLPTSTIFEVDLNKVKKKSASEVYHLQLHSNPVNIGIDY